MGERGDRRRERQCQLAREMLARIPMPIDGVLQVGLGDWAEGPAMLEWCRGAALGAGGGLWRQPFLLAVEPVERYRRAAYAAGFYGAICGEVVWSTSGQQFTFGDRRSKTSVLVQEHGKGLGTITATSITLDALYQREVVEAALLARCTPATHPSSWLLWLDCEGAEPEVLAGAREFLPRVQAVIMELKDDPGERGWLCTTQLVSLMEHHGFRLVYRPRVSEKYMGDGVFLREAVQ